MVARPTQRRKAAAAPARKAAAPAAKRTAPARKAAPKAAPKPQRADVTSYATKDVTDYHKAFARWIVEEVGYDPNSASSQRMAFLKGVSIATAARPAFMESAFLEEWRDKTGTAKRGPKPQEEAAPTKTRRAKAAPEPVEDDEDFEDDAEEFEDDEDSEDFEDDEDAEDDEDFEDDEDSDDDDADDEDFEEDEEPEPAPARRRKASPAAPAKRAPARGKAAPARKAAPAKAAPAARGRRAKADDDEFLF
jgi:hypothetical protein